MTLEQVNKNLIYRSERIAEQVRKIICNKYFSDGNCPTCPFYAGQYHFRDCPITRVDELKQELR